jgi:hypothetical protein
MLYIEDLKEAYALKKTMADIEKEIKELDSMETQEEQAKIAIAKEKEMLEYKLAILGGSYAEIVDFIKDCEDPLVSQVLYYKYLKNETWVKVAMLMGGYSSEENARKMAERYLAKKGITRRA